MIKEIEVRGQRVKLYSLDAGRTWSRRPQLLIAYGERKQILRLALQKNFARMDEIEDLDPNRVTELEIPKRLLGL